MKRDLKLSDIPKHNVHRVPEGYFDRLPMRIMERTAAREHIAAAPGHAQLWRALRYATAAFFLLLLFAGAYLLGVQQAPHQQRAPVAALSDKEIVDYLNAYAQVETIDLEEHLTADQRLASDFLNVSAVAAEEELEYYQLDDIDY